LSNQSEKRMLTSRTPIVAGLLRLLLSTLEDEPKAGAPSDIDLKLDEQVHKFLETKQKLTYFLSQ
jgi:hypothetical protein